MFLDEVTLLVRSGAGGHGVATFRREKFVPKGGPDGGDGGRGGDVILVASRGLNSLSHFKGRRLIEAPRGGPGERNLRHGADAETVRVLVPVGTVATIADTDSQVGELTEDGQELVVARGGRGGRGNAHFATSREKAPRFAELGTPAQELELTLELRLIADVGLVGLPNAGKSTLLAALTAARPKIADYPFTTLEPNLGVVEMADESRLVLADVPGLIEGASDGTGLGTSFLKHLSRTAVLVQVVDCSEELDACRAARDVVREELRRFDPGLAAKVRVMALNKIDVPGAALRAKELANEWGGEGVLCFAVSAQAGEGLIDLLEGVAAASAAATAASYRPPLTIYRPEPARRRITVVATAQGFQVRGRAVETIVARTDWENPAALARMRRQLETAGLRDALLEAGAKGGDTILVGESEFLFDPDF